MEITETIKDNDVCQLNLDGRFDANTAGIIENAIRIKMDGGVRKFILDMEKVSFVASAGLRVVLVIARELRGNQRKGDLYLTSLQTNVKKVFEISGLDNVLRIFDDADTAARNFRQS